MSKSKKAKVAKSEERNGAKKAWDTIRANRVKRAAMLKAYREKAIVRTERSMAQDKCVLICVERHGIGTARTLNKSQFEVDADKRRIGAHKRIMKESKAIDNINYLFDSEIENYLSRKCLPAPFRRGWYLIPTELIADVDKTFLEFQKRLANYVEQLIEELPAVKKLDSETLRGVFNDNDYPTPEEARSGYEITVRYIDFKVPDKLREISSKMFTRETEKLNVLWQETELEAIAYLTDAAKDMTDRLVTRLAEYGVKKGARFTDSMVENILEFVKDFGARNIAGDVRLANVVARMKNAIGNVTADNLRANDGLRTDVLKKFETIQSELDTLPIRAISLD